MDYDEERNTIYVHAISTRDRESVVGPIRRWEDYALRIFAEPLEPDDPVPEPGAVEDEPDDGPTGVADVGGEADGE